MSFSPDFQADILPSSSGPRKGLKLMGSSLPGRRASVEFLGLRPLALWE